MGKRGRPRKDVTAALRQIAELILEGTDKAAALTHVAAQEWQRDRSCMRESMRRRLARAWQREGSGYLARARRRHSARFGPLYGITETIEASIAALRCSIEEALRRPFLDLSSFRPRRPDPPAPPQPTGPTGATRAASTVTGPTGASGAAG